MGLLSTKTYTAELFSDQSVNQSVIHSKVTVTVMVTAALTVVHLFVHYLPNRVIDLVATKVKK